MFERASKGTDLLNMPYTYNLEDYPFEMRYQPIPGGPLVLYQLLIETMSGLPMVMNYSSSSFAEFRFRVRTVGDHRGLYERSFVQRNTAGTAVEAF